jgi:two-component system, chemotaxis family, protein-glutamate methylesterase/glutaminase
MSVAVATPLDNYRSAYAMPYQVIAIGGSAGGIQALTQILALRPGAFRIPILVVQHLRPCGPVSVLPTVLGRATRLTVKWADHGEYPVGGTVYIAPSDHHLTVAADQSLELSSSSPRVNFCRPAIDPLFESVARVFGTRAIAIVLSGMLNDGSRGTAAVHRGGGITMAQDELTSIHFDMPRAAIDLGGSQIRFGPRKIAEALCAIGL